MIPDILDKILGLLHSDKDYTTLESCSHVFPQFVDRHLYSEITLDIVERGLASILPLQDSYYHRPECIYHVVDPTKFSCLLIDNPHIANYVRVVQIIIKATSSQIPLSLAASLISQRLEDRLSFTSSILSTLPHPESILVQVRGPRVSWHMLGPKFCLAFQKSIQLPSVKSVAISNVNGLSLDHFDDCKNLQDLFLDGIFICGRRSTSPYPFSRMEQRSNNLHSLSLRIHSGYSLSDFHTLIEACSATLVNLDVNYYNNYLHNDLLSTQVFPDLHLPLLDHFVFRVPINEFGSASPRSLLIPFLGSIKSISSLSPIRLTLHLLYDHLAGVDWSLVTSVLVLPFFRHPIELHFTNARTIRRLGSLDVVSLLERNSDMKRLLEDGTLVTFCE